MKNKEKIAGIKKKSYGLWTVEVIKWYSPSIYPDEASFRMCPILDSTVQKKTGIS